MKENLKVTEELIHLINIPCGKSDNLLSFSIKYDFRFYETLIKVYEIISDNEPLFSVGRKNIQISQSIFFKYI